MNAKTKKDTEADNFERLIAAIEVQEGFGKPGRATENNNPGNIKYGPFARRMGAIGADDHPNRHAVFKSVEDGRNALRTLIRVKGNGMTLLAISQWYAEDPNWATGISKISGLSIYDKIAVA